MRLLTILAGLLMAACGIFSIANSGLTFISLAFPVGIVLIIAGIIESVAYKASSNAENQHWVLIGGITTFILGIVVLSGHLAADNAVPLVFGMWIMIAGIRGFVIVTQVLDTKEKDLTFFWTLIVSLISLGLGIYSFYNTDLLNLPVLMLVGLIVTIQGVTTVKTGIDMPYSKPDVIKTKDEKIAEAEAAEAKAKKEMKKAIKRVRKARKELEKAENAKDFHEIIAEPIVSESPLAQAKLEAEAEEEAEVETETEAALDE